MTCTDDLAVNHGSSVSAQIIQYIQVSRTKPVGHCVTCVALSAINSIISFTWTWRLEDTGLFCSSGSQNQGGACMADDLSGGHGCG